MLLEVGDSHRAKGVNLILKRIKHSTIKARVMEMKTAINEKSETEFVERIEGMIEFLKND